MSETKSENLSPLEIHHGCFVSEGRLVAFPMCFPGASVPIIADESKITALDITAEGDVYGGTSGFRTHLFAGLFRGVTGTVFDLGEVEEASHCPSVCCGREMVIACVNGPQGGKIVACKLQGLPFDLLQEWGFERHPIETIGRVGGGERIIHAVADTDRSSAVGISENHLFLIDLQNKKFELVAELKGKGRITCAAKHRFYGLDEEVSLWRFDLKTRRLERRAVSLPKGKWDYALNRWAKCSFDSTLYLADDEGHLYVTDNARKFKTTGNQTPLAPVTSMAVTHDGRLFGTCGEGMEHLFYYDPHSNELRDLGIALSLIERRRYGYQFGDAVTGKSGEIYFGENDDLGHLWHYYPSILPAAG